jgi:hypothetical protein
MAEWIGFSLGLPLSALPQCRGSRLWRISSLCPIQNVAFNVT